MRVRSILKVLIGLLFFAFLTSASKEELPKYDLRKTYHFQVDVEKQKLRGRGQWQLTGYAASDLRAGIAEVIAEGESKELYFQRHFGDMNIDSLEMINPGISTLPVMVNFHMTANHSVEKIDSEMVLQPFKIKDFNDNPFVGKSRIANEDFDFPYRVKEKIYITVPEGYYILGLPKNEELNIRRQNALVKLDVQEYKDKILLTFDFSIENPVFKKKDQDLLKALFDKFVKINQSAIILKKGTKLSSNMEWVAL